MSSGAEEGTGPLSPPVTARFLRPLAFALGAVLLAYVVYAFGSARVWLDLTSIGWRFLAIVGLEVLVSGANARAWWHTLPSQGRRGAFRQLFLVHLAGSALNEAAPGAPVYGEPVKVLLLKERFPVSVTTASLLSAKLAQALARVLFVILGMLAASWSLKFDLLPVKTLTVGFLLTAAGVGMFMALQLRGFSGPARSAFGRLRFLGSWVERLEHSLGHVDAHLQELYRSRPLDFVASLMLVVAGLGVGVAQIWLMMGWIGCGRDWLSSLTIEAFAVLVNFVLFAIPGSLGVQEGGKLLSFAALGLPVSAGLSIGIALRLNSVISVLTGLAALAWLRPHRVFQAARLAEPAEHEAAERSHCR